VAQAYVSNSAFTIRLISHTASLLECSFSWTCAARDCHCCRKWWCHTTYTTYQEHRIKKRFSIDIRRRAVALWQL